MAWNDPGERRGKAEGGREEDREESVKTPEEYTLQTTGAMSSQTFLDGFSFFVMV